MPTQEEYFFLTAFARQTKHQRVAKERKKHELQSYFCILCTPVVEESLQHLFSLCSFSQQRWATQTLRVLSDPVVSQQCWASSDQPKLSATAALFHGLLSSTLTSRNREIFYHQQPSVKSCKATFKHECAMDIHRGKILPTNCRMVNNVVYSFF